MAWWAGRPHRASTSHWARLSRFAVAQVVGLGLNSVIIWLLMRLQLTYESAMPIAVLPVPSMVCFLSKYRVFRQGAGTSPSTPAAPQATQPVLPPTNEE
ncbi:MAG: hypothetical protein PHI96_00045 [Desulfovibrio sp.]|nr:hypothetical protein [Desulfovibrio sp.]